MAKIDNVICQNMYSVAQNKQD